MSEHERAVYKFEITGIDCANCAAKLESKIAEIEGISNVSLSFMNNSLQYECDHDEGKRIEEVRALAAKEEPDAVIVPKGHTHKHHHEDEHHEHYHHHHHHNHEEHDHCEDEETCSCSEHEHHHHHDEETAIFKFEITGIDCANCAAKLESKIAEIEGISNVSLSFMNNSLQYECDHDEGKRIEAEVRALAAKEEPDAVIVSKGHTHKHHHHEDEHHEHHHHHHHNHEEHDHCEDEETCSCSEHEHHHHDDHEEEETAIFKFEITGIDCANCAAKLESKIAEIEGISNVSLSFMNNSLQYECDHDEGKRIEEEVRALAAKEEPDAVIVSKGHMHKHHHHEGEHHHHAHEEHKTERHHETALTRKYRITGIDCADCAARLERKMAETDGVENLSISFINSLLVFDCHDEDLERVEKDLIACADKEEPDAVIEKIESGSTSEYVYRIANIDCADCAEELAVRTAKIPGVVRAEADFMKEALTFECAPRDQKRIEQEMIAMIAKYEPEVAVSAMEAAETKAAPEEDDEDKKMLIRLAIGAVLFIVSVLLQGIPQAAVAIAAWLVLGYDVLLKAVRGIGRGQVFDEHFLMAVATIAAIYLKDYREAAGVMLFYQIGEYFQDLAVRRSRKSIGELMDIRPDYAWVEENGEFIRVSPEQVREGEIICVRPGEKVPLDGIVTKGASCLNTSSLTGESRLQDVDVDDAVISGAVNETGVLEIRVTKEYGESTVAKILELVENTDSRKAKQEKFITKFSRWYTPLVVFSALVTALIVSLIYGDVNEGIRRACTFLVISCPCALVISIPLSFFAGIGGLSGKGILVKGANVIETLANVSQAVFDKTGTLTTGEFTVDKIVDAADESAALYHAACAEYFSNHPLAEGIRNAYHGEIDEKKISDVQELAGRGLSVKVDGAEVLAGNHKLMLEKGIDCEALSEVGSLVYVAYDGKYEGCLVLNDSMKADAVSAIAELHEKGVRSVIVSGDHQDLAEKVGEKAGVDEVYGHCLPQDKVSRVKALCEKGTTVFVGDGVNDAPVLAAADAGFAMGVLGSDAAIEAADVVIMDDSLRKIPLTIKSASRIIRVANENIYGAIGIKLAILALGALGMANMWMAIFADTGVAMLCVLNSMRLLRIKE